MSSGGTGVPALSPPSTTRLSKDTFEQWKYRAKIQFSYFQISEHDVTTGDGENIQTFCEIINHPLWVKDGYEKGFDIALIKLCQPIAFSEVRNTSTLFKLRKIKFLNRQFTI